MENNICMIFVRALMKRKNEHHRNVKHAKTRISELAEHVYSKDDHVAWDDVKIIWKESQWSRRKWNEARLI